jgi:hypothetical protein
LSRPAPWPTAQYAAEEGAEELAAPGRIAEPMSPRAGGLGCSQPGPGGGILATHAPPPPGQSTQKIDTPTRSAAGCTTGRNSSASPRRARPGTP